MNEERAMTSKDRGLDNIGNLVHEISDFQREIARAAVELKETQKQLVSALIEGKHFECFTVNRRAVQNLINPRKGR